MSSHGDEDQIHKIMWENHVICTSKTEYVARLTPEEAQEVNAPRTQPCIPWFAASHSVPGTCTQFLLLVGHCGEIAHDWTKFHII